MYTMYPDLDALQFFGYSVSLKDTPVPYAIRRTYLSVRLSNSPRLMYFFLNSFSESRKHPEGSHFCRFYHPCWNDSVFTIIKVKGKKRKKLGIGYLQCFLGIFHPKK